MSDIVPPTAGQVRDAFGVLEDRWGIDLALPEHPSLTSEAAMAAHLGRPS